MFVMQENPGRNAGFFASTLSEGRVKGRSIETITAHADSEETDGGDGFLASLHGKARGHGRCSRRL